LDVLNIFYHTHGKKMLAFMDKFTAQTASANFLVPAQTIPYNAQFAQFIFLSVAFTKDILILEVMFGCMCKGIAMSNRVSTLNHLI
jgi:hypothetical protein